MSLQSFFIFMFILCFTGCVLSPVKNIEVAGEYSYPEQGENRKIYELILQLTSPHFFEYTQAARKLINREKEAVYILYKYRKLTREVDGTNILVCPPILQIILQKVTVDWLEKQREDSPLGLQKMIDQELKERKLDS